MRRVTGVLMGIALVALAVSPATAAETYHATNSGTSAYAEFSNIDWDSFDWDNPAPGSYFDTYIDVSQSLTSDGEAYGPGICVWYYAFTIDDAGQAVDSTDLGACGEASSFSVDRRLTTASVQASLPVTECLEWDEYGEECIGGYVELGTIDVDLSWTGTGSLRRGHDTGSSGVSGEYQATYHGTWSSRDATADGSVTLDSASLIDGPQVAGGLWSSRDGWTEVSITGFVAG